eukprot:4737807-Ditylum_brightwellii.AAC.1
MPEQTKSNFQPGGTATLVRDKWTSYICNSGKDKLGRWSYTTLKGKFGQRVTIVFAYCVFVAIRQQKKHKRRSRCLRTRRT